MSMIRIVSALSIAAAAMVAVRASAASFPAPVDGVITIDINSDVTYDEALPAATKLVKSGTGTATLTVDSTAFTGEDGVEITGGVLKLTTYGALGPTADITVSSGATLFMNTPGMKQTDMNYFATDTAHKLTIAGPGYNNMGAVRYVPRNTTIGNMSDYLFGVVTLSADATLYLGSRCGVDRELNLAGHTLTVTGNESFMLTRTKVYPGHFIVDGTAKVSTQSRTTFDAACTAANSSFTIKPGASIGHNYCPATIPHTIYVLVDYAANKRGKISTVDSTAGSDHNVFSGPIYTMPAQNTHFYVEVAGSEDAMQHWTGSSVISNQVRKSGIGTLVIKGNLEMLPILERRLQSDHGTLEFADGANVTNVYLTQCSTVGSAAVKISGGNLNFEVIDATYGQPANTAPIRQTGGYVNVMREDNFLLGYNAARNMGSYYFEGGYLQHNGIIMTGNYTNNTYTTPGRAVFRQKGGMMKRVGGNISIAKRGNAVWHQTGGTNDTVSAGAGEKFFMCSEAGFNGTLEIEGSNSVMSVGVLRWGGRFNGANSIISVKDGGTLGIHRIMCTGTDSKRVDGVDAHHNVFIDGGVFKPLRSGYLNQDRSYAEPDHFVIGRNGAVFDMSECYVHGGTTFGEGQMNFLMEAPTGKGLASITLPTTAAFTALTYTGPAIIDIEGPGYGAAAYADWDFTEKRLVPHISAPGCNYTDEDTHVYIWSPDGTTRHECGFTLADAPTTGAGITVRGTKRAETEYSVLTLYCRNSFKGPVNVEGDAALRLAAHEVLPVTTCLNILKNGKVDIRTNNVEVAALAGQGRVMTSVANSGSSFTLSDNGTIYVKAAQLFAEDNVPFQVERPLTIGSGVRVVVTDPENLPSEGHDAAVFLNATQGMTLADHPAINVEGFSVVCSGNTLALRRTGGGLVIVID